MSTARLSLDLKGPRHPGRCQACGRAGEPLGRWQEHDERDRPEPVVVVLCESCSGLLVERHPRLYRELQPHEPWPGCMDLCVGCRHRDGVRCTQAAAHGGPGVKVRVPPPTRAHVCRSPRRLSGWITIWRGPPTGCDRREEA